MFLMTNAMDADGNMDPFPADSGNPVCR